MRPKKRLLIVSPDEMKISLYRFLLLTRGFDVVAADSAEEALGILGGRQFDVVVIDEEKQSMRAAEVIARLNAVAEETQSILICDPSELDRCGVWADSFLSAKGLTLALLLERIRVCCARKRGPKKPIQCVGAAGESAERCA